MFFRVIIISLLSLLAIGSSMYHENYSINQIDNFTNSINYDSVNLSSINQMSDNKNNTFSTRLIGKIIDAGLFGYFGISKNLIQYGYEHPRNYIFLMWCVVFSVFIPLIIPTIYIIIFIVLGIKLLYDKWKKKNDRIKNINQ